MINRVFVDLLVFLLFFVIQIVMFAQLFNVISPPNVSGKDEDDLLNNEYRHIGMWMGNLLTVLRLSLGDFNFDVLNEPDHMVVGHDDATDEDILELNPYRVDQT